ncbi:MAG TPA: class I mannose-6-phosphate isomerase [bacterium]|nr:hypothetical protein [Myxococcales bacterium]HPW45922.1 class I mannose-6-phosphate isomerase [bacterium]HQG12947.1 class I mannose-6-phosphate isomerase [bacterium]
MPQLKELPWGGEKLAGFGKSLPAGKKIGESWELSGIPSSPSVAANGHLAGIPLDEIVSGKRSWFGGKKRLPLLVKLIDASENLSVQLHPDDRMAKKLGLPSGKTECWYVLHAEPGTRIIRGFKDGVDATSLSQAIASGKIEDSLLSVPVRTGDVIPVPAGTVHALGKGIVAYELQQSCDVTYRLFDWNRSNPKRELHIEEGIKSVNFSSLLPEITNRGQGSSCKVYSCEHFSLEKISLSEKSAGFKGHTGWAAATVISGSASIEYDSWRMEIVMGDTILLPEGLNYKIKPSRGECKFLLAYAN